MVGFTVTLTTRISCFLLITSAKRMNTGLAIKHPLDFTGMTYPSCGYRTRLQQKVCNIKSACAVGHAHTHGNRFHFGEVIFRRYLLRCFRKISHKHLHQYRSMNRVSVLPSSYSITTSMPTCASSVSFSRSSDAICADSV